MERRTVLSSVAAAGAVGTVGCLDRLRSGDGEKTSHHFELTIQNDHDQRYEVTAEMTGDEEVVFEQAFTIEPGDGRGFTDDFPAGRYVLSVDLAGRTSLRSYWNTDNCNVHLVRIDIAADGHVSQHVTCRASVTGPGPFGTAEGM